LGAAAAFLREKNPGGFVLESHGSILRFLEIA
jgi:hypothetical protein